MSEPLISIGIAVYNAQDTVGRAITSALSQEWPNTEIIVVDDASDDKSWQIIQDMADRHPVILPLRNPRNLGAGGTRNRILANAKGSYIAFFDDDDVSLPRRLRAQYERLQNYAHSMTACYVAGERIYPNGYVKQLPAAGTPKPLCAGTDMAAHVLYFGGPSCLRGAGTPACSLMAAKTVFDALGGFDPAMRRCEDMDFTVRLGLAGGHFIGCAEKLLIQYATTGGDKTHEANLDAEIYMAHKHADFLNQSNMGFYARQWPKIRYYHFKRQYIRMAGALFILMVRYPLKTVSHLLQTGPSRLMHERSMAR